MYHQQRRFTWDPRKSAENLAQRGFDYTFASRMFEGHTLEREDTRRDYGERRIVAIGMVEGIALTAVYTDRAALAGHVVRRIISARVASRRERKAYEAAIQAS
jgi:uncharacterized protein